MTVAEMDAAVANSIGSVDLMAPQKPPPTLAFVDLMTVGALFATLAMSLEQGLVLLIGKRGRKTQDQEQQRPIASKYPKNPPALQLVLLQIPTSVYQSV